MFVSQNQTYGKRWPSVCLSACYTTTWDSILATTATSNISITARANHRACQMLNGKVLLVGGDEDRYNPSMNIYDPATETFTRSLAYPSVVRYYQAGSGSTYSSFAIVNLSDGKVWIGGATALNDDPSGGYEIYDPVTDQITEYTIVNNPDDPYSFPRIQPVDEAYYIGNNQIMMFFSFGSQGILDLNTSFIHIIANDKLQGIGSMTGTSTIQDINGDIWQIGGQTQPGGTLPNGGSWATIFKFTVATQTWSRMHDMNTLRDGAGLAILPGNKIGIYGGEQYGVTVPLESVEIYDEATDTCTASVDLVGQRVMASTTFLQTGYVLIAGGVNSKGSPEDSELAHNSLLNPVFSGSTGTMTTTRYGHTATPLGNGLVLMAGGNGNSSDGTIMANTSAELFDPQAKLYINFTSEQIAVGGTMQFSALDATGATVTPTWSVDNQTLATIDSTGLLTTLVAGEINITATSGTDSALVRIQILPQ